LIDLTAHYSFALTDSLHQVPEDNSLSALPAGRTRLGGIEFDVRGLVHLAQKGSNIHHYAQQAVAIPIQRPSTRLHFLHACSGKARDGTPIGGFRIHYANGFQGEVSITYGQHVRDWHSREGEPTEGANASVVWEGTNERSLANSQRVRLYKTTWTNPMPDVEILSLDYFSKLTESAPFLLAITAEHQSASPSSRHSYPD